MKRTGFTLIELLVVIAIISLLAAILFPVFATAREKARQVSCSNNEKQILLAMIQYSQDYDETYPGFGAADPVNGNGAYWEAQVLPYLSALITMKSGHAINPSGVMSCPDDTSPGIGVTQVTYQMADNAEFGKFGSSKGATQSTCNTASTLPCAGMAGYCTLATGCSSTTATSINASQIFKPGNTLILVECPCVPGTSRYLSWPIGVNGPFSDTSAYSGCSGTGYGFGQDRYVDRYTPFHNGGWNYGFVDGHVKWMLPSQTIGVATDNDPSYCGVNYRPVPNGMWLVQQPG